MAAGLHSAPTTDPGADHAGQDAPQRERAFMGRLAAWCAGMVVLIGGGTTVGVAAATGSWVDGAVVGAFLSVFIAPALGGLLAGVLFVDREERAKAASRVPARPVAEPEVPAEAAPELEESRAA